MVLVAKKNLPANNFAEFQKYVTENQKKVQYGMAGIGAASHLGGLMLNSMMKVEVLEIPYKGTGPALNDLVSRPVRLHGRPGGERAVADQQRKHQGAGRLDQEAPAAAAERADDR